jgi:hypothetical protein
MGGMKTKAGRELQRIGVILERTLRDMSLEGKLKEHEVWNAWDGVVGKHVSRNAQPESIRNKILFVRVSTSPWMQQLSYMGEGIVEALNKRLGGPIVQGIRFKLGDIPPKSKTTPPHRGLLHTIPPLGKGAARKIQETLSPIKDVHMREILGRVMFKDMGSRKGKAR